MIYTENEIKGTASISKSSLVAKIAVAEVITVDTEEVKEEESVPEIEQDIIRDEKKWKWIATISLLVFAIAIVSFFILRYVGYAPLASLIQSAKSNIDKSFLKSASAYSFHILLTLSTNLSLKSKFFCRKIVPGRKTYQGQLLPSKL